MGGGGGGDLLEFSAVCNDENRPIMPSTKTGLLCHQVKQSAKKRRNVQKKYTYKKKAA